MTRPWFARSAICSAAIAIAVAGASLAKPGMLITREGQRYEGEITEKVDQIVVTIHGVDTIVNRENISSLTYSEAFNKEFADKLAKLEAKDVAGRIALARWAFDRRQYGKAREALDAAVAIDPNNRDAADLQNIIASQMKLEQSRGMSPDTKNQPTPPPNPTGVERRLITAGDINIMRQKELLPNDNVSVRFDKNVDKRYMTYRSIPFGSFNAMSAAGKALAILDQGDDAMKPDVKILNDPSSISEYRRVIQPLVMNGCGASNCHGGSKGGGLILYQPVDNEAVSYTNLYILTQYKKKVNDPTAGGVFGTAERKMIDRGHGVHSILLQYGLPVGISELDHPIVQGYDQVFKSPDEPRFRQIAEWMDKSLKPVPPDFGINYESPKTAGGATSKPAAPPTTKPPTTKSTAK